MVNSYDILMLQSLIEEKILVIEQRKDDARRLNKRYMMEINVHMAHMFHAATQQAFLPAEQRTATPESICKDLGVEFGKFETEPYIEAMKAEVEISYPNDIVDIIKVRKASARAQAGSSSVQAEPKSITPDPVLRPGSMPSSGTDSDSSAIGK